MSAIMPFPAPNVATPGACTSSTHKNPIVELKNGKVIFKQKPVSFEKASETMQEIVKFREMLNSRVLIQDQPLISIPEEHKPLIVKLAQESDKSIVPLAKHIRSILLPGPGEVEDAHRLGLESNLSLPVVEQAIKMVMTRINYGLDSPLGQKPPAAVCVWRWEVQDAYKDCFPKSARDSVDARLAERIQASADLRATFESLSQAEKDAILDPKGIIKLPAKDINKSETGTASPSVSENPSQDHASKDAPIADGEVLPENLAPKGRAKKALDPEKAAKIKDKEEKRAAKAEKEKKQKEAQDRSRSIMTNFFGKAKPSVRDSPSKDSNASADPPVDNEFQRTFKPFVLKKDAQIAPHNWFLEGKRRFRNQMTGVTHEEAIVVDDDTTVQGAPDPGMLSDDIVVPTTLGDSPASLRAFVGELRQSNRLCLRTHNVSSLKTYNPRSVRDTMSQLNDAEIAGDPTQVRHLLSVLRHRQVFPAKVLIFHEDSRPGYYGTWTRNSRIVGPRTPLERDVLARDYGYDSGEEWEDEAPGDADNVEDDGEDDEPDAEDADSDLDSWLVEDDDEIRPPLDLDDLSPPPLDPSMPPPKRKAENIEKRSDKKRKVVVPLVPYVKGPCWESYIGHCEYDPFNVYRIQLLNDMPHPIDPFTFVSVNSQVESVAVPSLPSAVQALAGTADPSASKRMTSSAPKTFFPEAHLGTLLAKISDLATPSLAYLVESIYQDLRIYKIKKNAIEAKVREICEKSKDKKVWVVKPAVQASHQFS
ncbi:chromatin assembly factor 1 subunit A-domain-containing protein [Butyriboletus roseoflavus]|nr:chromatin assembly factor 1 subunit A-domain-containing protein [Butyriboletus roseoflavus]